ncbi:MAG: prepilin-type N-terminal cleavage/methylation domain-containing protein [Syntrophomonas sp.]
MKYVEQEKGTTLLEILIALALVSIVVTGLFSVYWAGHNAFERQLESSDAQYCARTAMQWIVDDIMSSSKSERSPALNGDRLILYITTAGAAEPQEVAYFLNDTNLRRDNLAVMNHINYLNFQREAGKKLIRVTIEARVGRQSYRLINAATPRVTDEAKSSESNSGI